MEFKQHVAQTFKEMQDSICNQLEVADGKGVFQEEIWEREGGGGGRTRILTNGNIIEKGGVNFSAVHGKLPAKIGAALHMPDAEDLEFFASGVSIVQHPASPMVPIIHMNVRYFELSNGVWWFGGGIDLTPIYVVEEDARYFHQQMKNACDQHDPSYYDKFKTWADDYFFITHRKETRGIGGIFFDHLKADTDEGKQAHWNFVQTVGNSFAPTYTKILSNNAHLPYSQEHKDWQLLRRGRYVEFNLVLDRGTKFGLETDGRTESILMSLPPVANWEYNHQPAEGSQEAHTLSFLKKGTTWV